jgi:hypothetical protein
MKSGNAMDGAFSQSPQVVRDGGNTTTAPALQQEDPPMQRTAGLWGTQRPA